MSLKRQVWDLEAVLKVKDEVISARTAAVGLASVAPVSPPRARIHWTSWRTREQSCGGCRAAGARSSSSGGGRERR